MKNYYEILEVDKNASQEIINKAYKLLAKKYHPDLQENEEAKKKAEEKIKLINDAYDTLSDKTKREDYDKIIQNSFVSPEEYDAILGENLKLKQELNELQSKMHNFSNASYNNSNYQKNTSQNYYTKATNINNNYYSQNKQTPNEVKLTFIDYFKFYTKYFTIKLLKLIACLALIGFVIWALLKLPFFQQLFNGNNFIILLAFVVGLIYFYGSRN